ncbi:NAD(P)-binding protein [Gemmata sp. G18]|uniref:PF03932 family protein CutC n=1 Tax=Gemmata palustris TaxID=2822762 RepID=A0ABS5BKP8_9BACT|nr:copper homeostasis protein CutC [Gemmata palustris]MBP3953870.1 NAD(P)-binding protein [Gemmata palustris]
MTPRVAIIGAGLAGLTAAHRLLSRPSPPEVTIIDKGRHGGGRACTRNVDLPDGRKARFDLGPPNLYARHSRLFDRNPLDLQRVLDALENTAGALDVRGLLDAERGFQTAALAAELPGEDLFTRRAIGRIGAAGEALGEPITALTAAHGMRELAFRLLTVHGDRLDFRDYTLAEKLERTDTGWRVHTRSLRDEHRSTVHANALILTPPVPQTLELLERNKLALPDELRDALRKVTYSRCVALYGVFAGAGALQPGGVWLGDGPLEWITDNHLKNVSAVNGSITALTTDEWATAHWDEPDARIIELLLPRLRAWVGEPVAPGQVWVHKWRWARPVSPMRPPCVVLRDLSAVLAGDGFASASADHADAAVASGEAAAHRMGALLTALARRDGRYTVARPQRYTLEIAVTSPEEAVYATRAGADRLELSSGLALGGLTPSLGLFRAVRKIADGVPLYVLLRPREGGFAYSRAELGVMVEDAETFMREGADGIVFGALTHKGRVYHDGCRALVGAARGRAVFHRAFDFLPEPLVALDELIELGFERVLTSGGATTAEAGTTHLAALVQHAGWQIEILPAGRVRGDTVADLVRATRCDQVHAGPRAARADGGLDARPALAGAMGATTELDENAVRHLRQQLDGLVESLS